MEGKIALIASLDTKYTETMAAKEEILHCGYVPVLIDISTRTLEDRGADIHPDDILKVYGMPWEVFDPLGKAESIETMSQALAVAIPAFYREGRFDAIVCIGGGQNARMAAAAMKPLPFGVPKIIASPLACGKRTMEQYMGSNDIMVMHTVSDISMLNDTTRTVIANVCHAAVGMLEWKRSLPSSGKKKIAATMLGITTKGVEGALRLLPEEEFEKTVFHANGVGGRCMDSLLQAGKFDVVLDATLHEITCEVLGGYCTGANHRLMAAIEAGIPMVVVPGAIDMLDFFIDEDGNGLPADIDCRKVVYHNSSVAHTKIYPKEARRLAEVLAERLNQAKAPVTLVLPDSGFCEAAAPGKPMYDPEADRIFLKTVKKHLASHVRVVDVHGNINDETCQKAIAEEVLAIAGK